MTILTRLFEFIRQIKANMLKHWDIKNENIILKRHTGNYVWIDFDYDYEAPENPFGLDLFGMGNILAHAVGKGFHTVHMILQDPATYGNLKDQLDAADFSVIFKERFINLQKLYPEIPKPLNDILMHFSRRANVFYEYAGEMIEDLNRCMCLLQ
jgi:hypothetical protein